MKQHSPREAAARAAWLAKHQRLDTDQQVDLGNAYHMSLQAILRGCGSDQAWHTIVCTLNIALILCEQGYSPASIETIKLAQEAMLTCRTRAAKHGRMAFTGDEARVVMAAINIHDEQISRATRDKVSQALREVHRRIENGDTF